MGDLQLVQVLQGQRHLSHPNARLLLAHRTIVQHKLEQVTILSVSHKNEDLVPSLKDAVNMDDVRMG
jgi:hypothetical protein